MECVPESDDFEELRGQVRSLELRLAEANHRIANSLQMASFLAGDGAGEVRDPVARSRLAATQNYIEAIAGVHHLLSGDHPDSLLPLDTYLSRLVGRLQAAAAHDSVRRVISLQTDPVQASPESAVWIGMVLIELVSNAWKYAYAPTEVGEVRVKLARRERGFVLQVEDDGPGVDLGQPAVGSGLGTRMITAMARRFGAEFGYESSSSGARAVLVACGPRDERVG